MGYEISRIMDTEPEAGHSHTIVSGQANKARYAIAALKSKVSAICSTAKNLVTFNKFNEEALLGVDITPSCIYVCQIDNKGGNRALTGLASVCMEGKFVGEDILSNPNLYSEGLKKLIAENNIQAKKVAVSLPVSSSIVKVATISKMNDAEITRAIKYGSLWQNLMSQEDSPDNYSIFYQVIRRDDGYETMDILLVATKLADIKLYKDIVINSGLQPVIIDAKSVALHYAMKNRPLQNGKHGTVLIEFGLDDNYIMVMGDSRPRVFTMEVSELERAAILGRSASGDSEIVDELISRYSKKLKAIIAAYNRMKPEVCVEDVYVMSSLPLINSFMGKLKAALKECQVRECSMFDYLVIPDSFSISKDSAKNNISAWAGAIGMAMFPWRRRNEDWIEIRKSPACGTRFFRHQNNLFGQPKLSMKIGDFDPYETYPINTKSTLARLASYPDYMAIAAAVLCFCIIIKSYYGVIGDRRQLAVNDDTFSAIISQYNEKTAELANLQSMTGQLDSLQAVSAEIVKDENQQYVLSMYNYLDTILQQGVWLKQLTFTAPNDIEIEGRSIDDGGVMSFLGTINDSKMFSKMALKHIQSIQEMDLYARNSTPLKGFIFKGNLSDTLPGEYLNKPNMVAGGMLHGG